MEELQKTRNLLETCQLDCQQKSQCILDLNNKVMQQQQLLEAQKLEIEGLKKKLIKVRDENNAYAEHEAILIRNNNNKIAQQQQLLEA